MRGRPGREHIETFLERPFVKVSHLFLPGDREALFTQVNLSLKSGVVGGEECVVDVDDGDD